MSGVHPLYDPEDMKAILLAYNREPFTDTLAYLMGCRPSERAVQEFAEKYPDRWAQACAIFARLAGFSEKTEIEHNVNIMIGKMGDAQLLQRLSDIQGELIDVTPAEQEEGVKKEAPEGAPV